ncbi:hypothetical protein V8E55_001337 [Tylopilus felleus]
MSQYQSTQDLLLRLSLRGSYSLGREETIAQSVDRDGVPCAPEWFNAQFRSSPPPEDIPTGRKAQTVTLPCEAIYGERCRHRHDEENNYDNRHFVTLHFFMGESLASVLEGNGIVVNTGKSECTHENLVHQEGFEWLPKTQSNNLAAFPNRLVDVNRILDPNDAPVMDDLEIQSDPFWDVPRTDRWNEELDLIRRKQFFRSYGFHIQKVANEIADRQIAEVKGSLNLQIGELKAQTEDLERRLVVRREQAEHARLETMRLEKSRLDALKRKRDCGTQTDEQPLVGVSPKRVCRGSGNPSSRRLPSPNLGSCPVRLRRTAKPRSAFL